MYRHLRSFTGSLSIYNSNLNPISIYPIYIYNYIYPIYGYTSTAKQTLNDRKTFNRRTCFPFWFFFLFACMARGQRGSHDSQWSVSSTMVSRIHQQPSPTNRIIHWLLQNLFRWKQEVGLLQEINELTHKIGAISQMFDSKFQHRSSPCSSHLGFKKLVKAPLTFSANFYTVVIERREASKR